MFFDIPTKGCVNFHLSFLPYNRGTKPNVWAIVEGTPAGVTLHYVDEDIDSGQIIAQSKVEIDAIDTGMTLYYKLLNEIVELFQITWLKIKNDKILPKTNKLDEGTLHYNKDIKDLDLINLDKQYKGSDLINILRSRTFPPHPSAYFIHKGRKVYISVNLDYEEKV